MTDKLYLYWFEEGSNVGYGISCIGFATTSKPLTDENVKEFAKVMGGQDLDRTELLEGDGVFSREPLAGIDEDPRFSQGRHYSIVQLLGQIDAKEAETLKRLGILGKLGKNLEDRF